MSKIISLSEVRQHKNSESCWVVIHNDVYDVTSYLNEHPGGEEALLDVAGKDGTQNFEDVGHSDDAREIMKKFKIGSLAPGENTKEPKNISHPMFEGTTVTAYSCEHIPRIEEPGKTWRTFDGASASLPKPDNKPIGCKKPSTPKIVRRVKSIIVPKERRGRPCEESSGRLKWAILALAGALVIGIVVKKYMA